MYIFKVDVKNYRFIENKNIPLRRFQKNMSQKIRKCIFQNRLRYSYSRIKNACINFINQSILVTIESRNLCTYFPRHQSRYVPLCTFPWHPPCCCWGSSPRWRGPRPPCLPVPVFKKKLLFYIVDAERKHSGWLEQLSHSKVNSYVDHGCRESNARGVGNFRSPRRFCTPFSRLETDVAFTERAQEPLTSNLSQLYPILASFGKNPSVIFLLSRKTMNNASFSASVRTLIWLT